MDKQALKNKAVNIIDGMAAELKDMSLYLHSNPELGGSEYHAADYLVASARRRGFAVQSSISGYETAFISHKGIGGPRIGFLAEYDALPKIGHGCGHNLIAAMSWGAAAAFAESAGDRAASYFIGCPAEETTGGKISMAQDGVLTI
jgi:metal-dependent amidase/aminoacylase/carboxypeptidase family protein